LVLFHFDKFFASFGFFLFFYCAEKMALSGNIFSLTHRDVVGGARADECEVSFADGKNQNRMKFSFLLFRVCALLPFFTS
jgi:hypothetical protein